MIRGRLETALRAALEVPELQIQSLRSVAGGCIHNAARLVTTAGDFFAKWNDACPPDLFLREADGLRELAAAESGLVVPRVLAASEPVEGAPPFIIMEYLSPGKGSGDRDDERLARGLASVHRRRGEAFGFAANTYCGATSQDNSISVTWLEFYAERRLRPILGLIDRNRAFSTADRRVFDRLIPRLDDLLPAEVVPSLIHGDLWSGNVMATSRGPAIFDPACAYADREMEFGITTLFGGFSERFWSAYEEAWPLSVGWRERNPLYQVYHLLNHHLLFGGHYGREALAIAKRFS
jgi:protein-ribulosamine 3-kinase